MSKQKGDPHGPPLYSLICKELLFCFAERRLHFLEEIVRGMKSLYSVQYLSARVQEKDDWNAANIVFLCNFRLLVGIDLYRDKFLGKVDDLGVGISIPIQLLAAASPIGVEIHHNHLLLLRRGGLGLLQVRLPLDRLWSRPREDGPGCNNRNGGEREDAS